MNLKNKLKTTETTQKTTPNLIGLEDPKEICWEFRTSLKFSLGESEQMKIKLISSLPSREMEIEVQTEYLYLKNPLNMGILVSFL